jgi:hypothetical protein
MEPQPQVLDVDGAAARLGHERLHPLVEGRAQLADDFVLVAEVVVEIAGADAHFAGDFRCRDLRRAAPVEEDEARLEDALARSARSLFLGHEAIRGGDCRRISRARETVR